MIHLPYSPVLWGAAWLVLVVTGLSTRPLMPVDETRYLAVAWEMWLGGDYLVPHLNGEHYSHKPPLLFWLINLGWAVFGVNDWWARLVAPLFGLGSLVLTMMLGRRLWPDRLDVGDMAPLILVGGLFWGAFTTLTMFDMLVCFFTLAALLGVVDGCRRGGWRGWLLAGVAIGLGVLSKGPVILIHVLPVALCAPLWAGGGRRVTWGAYYARLSATVLIAAAVALAWVVPAAIAGGAEYREAILWGQTAGRISESFAHGRPWWFYLAALPAALLPWILWPPVWRGLYRVGDLMADPGSRFCLVWLALVMAILALVSGKQPHYLIPSLPAAALLLAAVLGSGAGRTWRFDQGIPLLLFVLPALALALAIGVPPLPQSAGLPALVRELAPLMALPAALAAVVAAWMPMRIPPWRVVFMGIASVLLVVSGHLAVQPHLRQAFDLKPLAEYVGELQGQGIHVANVHKYHGQYQYLGRLRQPLAITWQHEARQWAAEHPGARMIVSHNEMPDGIEPGFVQRFRGRSVAVWEAETVLDRDDIVKP